MAYGLEATGPDGTTVVWSSALRATNIQVYSPFTLTAGQSVVIPCADADNASSVIITLKKAMRNVIITTKTSTSFTLENANNYTVSGAVLAIRVS
jgi:hypothetical protein